MGNSSRKALSFSSFGFRWPLSVPQLHELEAEFRAGRVLAPNQVQALIAEFNRVCPGDPGGKLQIVDVQYHGDATLTIVGDIHGQFWDLLNIFSMNGHPSESRRYVLNGDYVDRGAHGLEVVLLLIAWKVMLPQCVYLMRGNHELEIVNSVYGFHAEVDSKYGDTVVFEELNKLFCQLPVSAVVKDAVFVVHGGLPRARGITLDQIRGTSNSVDPVEGSMVSDMLWSDPTDIFGLHPSPRNIGVLFGPDVAAEFLEANQLQLVVRAHELCMEGYSIQQGGKVVTVFSAPNYCGRCQNFGAFLVFDSDLKMTIRQFAASAPQTVMPSSPIPSPSAVISSYF